jgi:hypothetical protein
VVPSALATSANENDNGIEAVYGNKMEKETNNFKKEGRPDIIQSFIGKGSNWHAFDLPW